MHILSLLKFVIASSKFGKGPLDTQQTAFTWSACISCDSGSYRDRHVRVVNLIDTVPQVLGEDVLSRRLKTVAVVVVVDVASQNIAVSAWHQNQAEYYLHLRLRRPSRRWFSHLATVCAVCSTEACLRTKGIVSMIKHKKCR